jgi:hypothetical protein
MAGNKEGNTDGYFFLSTFLKVNEGSETEGREGSSRNL